jgi:hypothetical protein
MNGEPHGVSYRQMVSAKDREHFRRIGEIEAELNREAIRESAA